MSQNTSPKRLRCMLILHSINLGDISLNRALSHGEQTEAPQNQPPNGSTIQDLIEDPNPKDKDTGFQSRRQVTNVEIQVVKWSLIIMVKEQNMSEFTARKLNTHTRAHNVRKGLSTRKMPRDMKRYI